MANHKADVADPFPSYDAKNRFDYADVIKVLHFKCDQS